MSVDTDIEVLRKAAYREGQLDLINQILALPDMGGLNMATLKLLADTKKAPRLKGGPNKKLDHGEGSR